MKHLLLFRLFLLSTFLASFYQTTLGATVNQDGINYIVYISGEKDNAVADSAYVGNNRYFTDSVAHIASSVTYTYKYSVLVGYDEDGRPLYESRTRYLTAPVKGIIDAGVFFDGGAFSNSDNLKIVTIPNTVTYIGYMAFWWCFNLKSVNIPNSVTYIGDAVFYDCGLEGDLIIPNSVTHIGKNAFSNCRKLNSVSISNSLTHISNGTFHDCSSLTSVHIPSSVTSIGSSAFFGCSGMTRIDIPNSVTSIDSRAFSECIGLTSVIIPNSVTNIGEGAFLGCSGLTSVTLGNSVYSIGGGAFRSCTNLTSINIPNSVNFIGSYAFKDCNNLPNINIPNYVISIGEEAFYSCDSLLSISIGKSVSEIGYRAFMNCNNLKELTWNAKNCSSTGSMSKTNIEHVSIGEEVQSLPNSFLERSKIMRVTIPNSVTSIGDYAFLFCTYLTDIICLATTPPLAQSNSFSNYSAMLHVPVGSIEAYQSTVPWSNFTNIVGINEPGDVNGDGGINISDVTSLIDILLSGNEASGNADVDGDGQVNISDVTALIDMLLSGN